MEPGRPGIDCDDFADMMAAWLKRYIGGDVEVKLLGMWYYNSEGKYVGHMMTIVILDGYYYIIDPQTGRVIGPFSIGTPYDPRPILEPAYDFDPNRPVKVKPQEPNERRFPEPAPWHEDEHHRQRVPEILENPAEDYILSGVAGS